MQPQIHRRKGIRGRIYLRNTGQDKPLNTGHTMPRVDDVFAYRARARPIDPELDKLLGLSNCATTEAKIRCQTAALKWLNHDQFGCKGVHDHILVKPGNRIRIFMFWSRDRKLYYFIEFNYFHKFVRKSYACSDREFAMGYFNRGLLEWEETVSFAPSQ